MASGSILWRLGRDPLFWLAHLAALGLWTAGYVWLQPDTDWAWPVHQPDALVILGLAYPVVEEWLFRGWLQGALLRRPIGAHRRFGMSSANLLTSVVFTALHFFAHPPLAAAAVFIPSLVFGFFRDRYGRLLPAIWLHIFYNVGYFWVFASGG